MEEVTFCSNLSVTSDREANSAIQDNLDAISSTIDEAASSSEDCSNKLRKRECLEIKRPAC